MSRINPIVCALAAGAAFAAARPIPAQDIQWASAVNGFWSDVSKWNPQNVPDNAGENAVLSVAGTYTATLDFDAVIGALKVTRKTATVAIPAGRALYINANSTNAGKILINSNKGTASAFVRFDFGDRALAGAGEVVLALGSDDLDDARLDTYGATLTIGADQTVRGAGTIGALLVNNGTIAADSPGQILRLSGFAKTNNNVIKAAAGSVLYVNGMTLSQGAQGLLLADGGQIDLLNATVAAGTLNSAGQGRIRALGTGNFLDTVTNAGDLGVADASAVYIHGGLANGGVITINPDAGSADSLLRFDQGDQALSGAGEVRLVLGSADLNDARLDTYGATLTVGPQQTIRGAGTIGAALIINGTIIADTPGQILQLSGFGKANNALVKAAAGSVLYVNGATLSQGVQGLLLADGGQVWLSNTTIAGGTLDSAGQGRIRALGTGNFLDTVTNAGELGIADASAVYIHGGLANGGVITINPGAGSADSLLRFDFGDQVLSGTGEVRLVVGSADLNDARLDTYGATLTVGAQQTIRGAGTIGATLVNDGTITADTPGKTLRLSDFAKTNHATISALPGSELRLGSVTVSQGPQGVIQADGGQVSIVNSTIAGGSLASSNGGRVVASGANILNGGPTISGGLDIADGSGIIVHNNLTNNGLITINPDAGSTDSLLRFDFGDQVLDGSGAVRLVLGSPDFNDAVIGTYGASLTIGPDQTITGSGRLSGMFTLQGTLAPGDPIGRLDVQGPITCTPAAALAAQVGGPNAFDQVTVNGTATLAGTVHLELIDGYVPGVCAEFPIVTATTIQGAFDSVTGPAGQGRTWRMVYTPTQARAVVTCYADTTADCTLDLFDFLVFVNLFNAGDPEADCTGDGVLDLFDFLCFVNAFNAGC